MIRPIYLYVVNFMRSSLSMCHFQLSVKITNYLVKRLVLYLMDFYFMIKKKVIFDY